MPTPTERFIHLFKQKSSAPENSDALILWVGLMLCLRQKKYQVKKSPAGFVQGFNNIKLVIELFFSTGVKHRPEGMYGFYDVSARETNVSVIE